MGATAKIADAAWPEQSVARHLWQMAEAYPLNRCAIAKYNKPAPSALLSFAICFALLTATDTAGLHRWFVGHLTEPLPVTDVGRIHTLFYMHA